MKLFRFALAAVLLGFAFSFAVSADSAYMPVTVSYTDYHGGVVVKHNSASVENVVYDGRDAVKIVPNPEYTGTDTLKIDAYSFSTLGIDLDYYKWLVIEYKYISDNPGSYEMVAHYKTNGGLLKPEYLQKAQTAAAEPVTVDEWQYAVFDFRFIEEMLTEELDSHILRQMHLLPFGYAELSTLSAEDTVYIGRLTFMSEKPDIKLHNAVVHGYDDGTFRPGNYLTRAEACALVARSLGAAENVSAGHPFKDFESSEWYSGFVGYCWEAGLLKESGTEFSPLEYITRQEFARMVYLSSLPENQRQSAGEDSFPEKTTDSGNISREQAVIMINRRNGIDGTSAQIGAEVVLAYFDVSRLHRSFGDIVIAGSEYVSSGGQWLYNTLNSTNNLGDTLKPEYFDLEKGRARVLELDALEKQRINEIRCTENGVPAASGRVYYVSNDGDDDSSGLSENSPLCSLAKALSAAEAGDAVVLRRGDLFRGNFSVPAGVTLSAYGFGEKPKIYGSPLDGADSSLWTLDYSDPESGARIWKFAAEDMKDVGNIVFNGGEKYAFKDIPSCTSDGSYVLRGLEPELYDYRTELDFDLNFFHSANSVTDGDKINITKSTGALYLRCDSGNPGEVFDSIEFSPRGNAIKVSGDNVTVDNICVMYAGSHGVGAGTVKGLTVTNCEFGWIGGSVQHYNNTLNRATRFGNGVEIYGGCDGYLVENCYIYQCYDAGVTHQFNASGGEGDYVMYNVTYKDNLITDCVYSIEYFFNEYEGYIRDGNNILFESNLMRRCGFGFGSTRPNGHAQRHIRSNPYGNPFRNFVIRNNILDRSVQDLFRVQVSKPEYFPVFEGNTYITGVGNDFFTYGTGSGITYPADVSAEAAIRTIIGDLTGEVYFTDHVEYYTFPSAEKS